LIATSRSAPFNERGSGWAKTNKTFMPAIQF
jgi:hypothetical protein